MDPRVKTEEIAAALREKADPARAVQEKRYLKSQLEHLGVSVPAIRKVAVAFVRSRAPVGRAELLELVEVLWCSGIHEHRMCAVELLDLGAALLAPEDMPVLERLLRELKTWALVDNLAAGPVAALVESHSALGSVLDRWAGDGDFWIRRSALLALLPALRRGGGDFDGFARYAEAMLPEKEFFIRKAIGWVLRDTGRKRPMLVHQWLLPRTSRAAGLTVREAVRHLPDALKSEILARLGRRTGPPPASRGSLA